MQRMEQTAQWEDQDYAEDDLLDEDGGYEQRRQRRIDLEDWQAETLRQKQECENENQRTDRSRP